MTNKCSATVYDQTGWGHSYACSRNGKIEEDSKWWCKQHAPSSVKARADAATARYNAKTESFLAPGRELDRLRAVNAKLLGALEGLREDLQTRLDASQEGATVAHGLVDGKAANRSWHAWLFGVMSTHGDIAREAIEEATK